MRSWAFASWQKWKLSLIRVVISINLSNIISSLNRVYYQLLNRVYRQSLNRLYRQSLNRVYHQSVNRVYCHLINRVHPKSLNLTIARRPKATSCYYKGDRHPRIFGTRPNYVDNWSGTIGISLYRYLFMYKIYISSWGSERFLKDLFNGTITIILF